LLQAGFPPSDLYAANEWKESAHALKESQSFSDRYHGPAQRALKESVPNSLFAPSVYYGGVATQPAVTVIQCVFQGTVASGTAIRFTMMNTHRTG
jgi:hypothetical protein